MEDPGADTGEGTELILTNGEPLFRLIYMKHKSKRENKLDCETMIQLRHYELDQDFYDKGKIHIQHDAEHTKTEDLDTHMR